MKILTTQYSQFTPEERLRLTLAAGEQGDNAEIDRLMRSCPQVTRVVRDPRYMVRLGFLMSAVCRETMLWTEVSTLLLVSVWTLDTTPAKDVALVAKADAAWKTWSAVWRGIESGISKFCADADLPRDQLLALAGERPVAIEVAGRGLYANARANGRCAQAVQQRLWEVWQSGNKP
jgi:hypothetical protein